jgi:hypothetical protein
MPANSSPNLEVRHHNVVDDPVDRLGYDLIHALQRAGLVDVAVEGEVHCLATADLGRAFLPVLGQLGERIVGYTPLLVAARGRRSDGSPACSTTTASGGKVSGSE